MAVIIMDHTLKDVEVWKMLLLIVIALGSFLPLLSM